MDNYSSLCMYTALVAGFRGAVESGADPEKRKGDGAELRLDWDGCYLAPMKYCLRFEEETSTP